MKAKEKLLVLMGFMAFVGAMQLPACKVSEQITAKPGAQLWAENCIRCHNVPSPADFSNAQWGLIGSHMRLRAHLTAQETEKIVEFLKMAN